MTCYYPNSAWVHPSKKTENGKDFIVFKHPGVPAEDLKLPCGKCDGCRIDRTRQWATRCILEATLYQNNCFITLTYSPKFLPKDGTLVRRHLQLFLKRLRRAYPQNTIRYFACGEYGLKKSRPHYHVCLFNFDFPKENKIVYKQTPAGPLYVTSDLHRLWGTGKGKNFKSFGFTTVGSLSWESVAYTARYILKKLSGLRAKMTYYKKVPEFNAMSLKPGIGAAWLEKFKKDIYPDDFVVLPNKRKMKVPKYFDKKYSVTNSEDFLKIQLKREQYHAVNKTSETDLARMAECKAIQLGKLKRSFEDGTS